jgi:predicted metalloprotease with PDZ domain
MWRGGLSAPASLYIHADRPLISENATSTLLHELMHTAVSVKAVPGYDWIVEGLAEFYSLQLLKRGGAISDRRYANALSDQAEWAQQAEALCGSASTGATTALAVSLFVALDREIRDKTANKSSFDDVLRRLVALKDPIDHAALTAIVAKLIGQPSDVLHIDKLPGCPKMAADEVSS